MSVENVNNGQNKPIKTTKIGTNAYQYEYADGTIKCVFDEKNSVTYNKKENKDIRIENDWGDVSVFNGKNVEVDMKKHCTGVTLENCKDSYINARHNSTTSVNLNNSTNMTIDADPEDRVSSNGTNINHPRFKTFKVNDKTYTKNRKLTNNDAPPQERAKIYDTQLFNGSNPKGVKFEEGVYDTGFPVGGIMYKKASFPNGDIVVKTSDGQYLEYNTNNNKNIQIAANASDGLNIKNANGLNYINTKSNNYAKIENSANCSYSSKNNNLNEIEILNCKNTNVETDEKDTVINNGKTLPQQYGKRVIK